MVRKWGLNIGIIVLVIAMSLISSPVKAENIYNTAFFTDEQLTDTQTMNIAQIQAFLLSKGSYLSSTLTDVDGISFSPAQAIADAASQYTINPQVIIATLQKESSSVSRSTPPANLGFIAGCKTSSTARQQIACAAERFRSYQDSLINNGQTVSGWKVGVEKQTQDNVNVVPATRAIAGQFTYTPYAGSGWGGNKASVGGVYLFYKIWNDYGFGLPVAAITPSDTPLVFLPGSPSGSGKTVGIEAGHSSSDQGASSCDGVYHEAAITYDIAQRVQQKLTSAGYQVTLFRDNKASLVGSKFDAFVALHVDYCPAGNVSGYKAGRYGGAKGTGLLGTGDASDRLTQAIWDNFGSATGIPQDHSTGHYTDDFRYYFGLAGGGAGVSSETPSAILEMGWMRDPDLSKLVNNPDSAATGIYNAISSFLGSGTTVILPSGGASTTVMVLDASGSMNSIDPSGKTKINAAISAGSSVLDILAAEIKADPNSPVKAGILHFNVSASVDFPIGNDFQEAQNRLASILANNGTGMPDGLQKALELIQANHDKEKQIIILLSDGMPNIGLGGSSSGDIALAKQQSLDLARQAGDNNICIYTVGFGNPSAQTLSNDWIDEQFLKDMAAASKCGAYYNAQDARQLDKAFIEVRHTSTGNILLDKEGQIAQNEKIIVGTADVKNGQEMALLTLNWPGSQLDPILIDPSGRAVDSAYPNASISTTKTLATIIIQNPSPGQWQVGAVGVDVPEGRTTYSAIFSTRAGIVRPGSQVGVEFIFLALAVAGGGLAVYTIGRNRKTPVKARASATASLARVGSGSERVIVKIFDGFLIGRGSTCHLKLPDPQVSRVHAQFRLANGVWFIQDQSSTAGTFVNGQKVNAIALKPGDHIQIGSNQFELRS